MAEYVKSYVCVWRERALSSVPSIVAACSPISMLTVRFLLHELPISLGIDTGASVTLIPA